MLLFNFFVFFIIIHLYWSRALVNSIIMYIHMYICVKAKEEELTGYFTSKNNNLYNLFFKHYMNFD